MCDLPTSQISSWYAGRSILVTGGTGFMGKVLVEKLLRSCSGVRTIYLLLRPKRGCKPAQRLQEMINITLFDWLRVNDPSSLNKLIAITGDITEPNLGLSPEDELLLMTTVSVVFHSAATVKFDEQLKLSVEMNVLGTKRLVQLCQKMKHLDCLVHVSTAYCNCDKPVVTEQVYPAPADPDDIQQCVSVLSDDVLSDVTNKIIGNRPNTYTFTKAMAESVLIDMAGNLPVAIVRPSIVTAAWKEPLPGWVDNLNGPTGLFAGAGKGILRTIICHRDLIADLIPVDICINLLVAVAWHTATSRPNNIIVYNCTSGTVNPIRWGQVESLGHRHILANPFNEVLWYPGGSFKRSILLNNACVYLFHLMPAYLLDAVAKASGKKPIMVRVQSKLRKAVNALEFFTINEWRFPNDNVMRLLAQLDASDRQIFDFDVSEMDWERYIENYVMGTRRYIMKEDDKTLANARRNLMRMYWLDRITKALLITAVWRIALSQSTHAQWISSTFWTIAREIQSKVINFVMK